MSEISSYHAANKTSYNLVDDALRSIIESSNMETVESTRGLFGNKRCFYICETPFQSTTIF